MASKNIQNGRKFRKKKEKKIDFKFQKLLSSTYYGRHLNYLNTVEKL